MSRPVANEFPSADPGALRIALVGESPGADEVAQGRPFVGKSGWILNQYLASAGVSRAQCFVGNVCQCKPSPTSNEFHLFEWHEPRVQEGIAALREDLARFRPNIVVALGNAALHLLRHGNVAPPKSAKLRLFQWTNHIGTWRGSLFLGARDFDACAASELRRAERDRYASLLAGQHEQVGLSMEGLPDMRSAIPAQLAGQPRDAGSIPAPATLCGSPLAAPERDERANAGAHSSGNSTAAAPAMVQGPPAAAAFASTSASTGVVGTRSSGETDDDNRTSTPHQRVTGSTPVAGCLCNAFKCLSTYHPAATFREPSFAFPLVSDLKRAVAEARSPSLDLPPRNIRWGLPIDELEARCAAIRTARTPVGFDIEGGLRGLQCCSFATSPADAFVIDLMGECLDRPRTLAAIAAVLEDPAVPKVLWNAAYERAILAATASVTLRGYEDGMLAWWERFSELPKGLDFVASILTREPYWAEGIGWDRKTGAPKVTGPRFLTYNAIDSLVTLEIWQHPLIRTVTECRTPVPFDL